MNAFRNFVINVGESGMSIPSAQVRRQEATGQGLVIGQRQNSLVMPWNDDVQGQCEIEGWDGGKFREMETPRRVRWEHQEETAQTPEGVLA